MSGLEGVRVKLSAESAMQQSPGWSEAEPWGTHAIAKSPERAKQVIPPTNILFRLFQGPSLSSKSRVPVASRPSPWAAVPPFQSSPLQRCSHQLREVQQFADILKDAVC
jgi:hypothetical protein